MQRSLSNYLLGHFIWFDLLIGFLWPLPMPNLLVSVSARISENSLDTRFLYISNSIFYFNFAITRISSMKNALKLFRQPTLSFWLLNCSRVLMIFFFNFFMIFVTWSVGFQMVLLYNMSLNFVCHICNIHKRREKLAKM